MKKCWFSALIVMGFVCALLWAKAEDPFVRKLLSIRVGGHEDVKGVGYFTKPVSRRPAAIYVPDAGTGRGDWTALRLRQLAELGVAAVGIECDATNQGTFDIQFFAALDFVRKQSWTGSNASV